MIFYTEMEKSTLKFIWNKKIPKIAKAILSKKRILRVSQYLTSNYTTEPLTAWYSHQNRLGEQNRRPRHKPSQVPTFEF
jgi:hypothetical protein